MIESHVLQFANKDVSLGLDIMPFRAYSLHSRWLALLSQATTFPTKEFI